VRRLRPHPEIRGRTIGWLLEGTKNSDAFRQPYLNSEECHLTASLSEAHPERRGPREIRARNRLDKPRVARCQFYHPMKPRTLGFLSVCSLVVAGCATTSDKPSASRKNDRPETVDYAPVGSHIKKRVKKPTQEKYAEDDPGVAYLREAQSFPKFTDLNEGSGPPKK
jgi:hypothetical protein